MSSTRFSAVVTGSAVLVLLVAASSPGTATVSAVVGPPDYASQQPRDPRSDVARPETQRELELKAATAAEPAQLTNWFELAKLQEDRGAIADAERTYKARARGSWTEQGGLHTDGRVLQPPGAIRQDDRRRFNQRLT